MFWFSATLALLMASAAVLAAVRPASADPEDYTTAERLDHLHRLMRTGSAQLIPKLVEVLELAEDGLVENLKAPRNPVTNDRMLSRVQALRRAASGISVGFFGIAEKDEKAYERVVGDLGALYPDLDAMDYEARSRAARARLSKEFDEALRSCRNESRIQKIVFGPCKQVWRIVWQVASAMTPILKREETFLKFLASSSDDRRIADAQTRTQQLLAQFRVLRAEGESVKYANDSAQVFRELAKKYADDVPLLRAKLAEYSASLGLLP